MKRMVGSWWPCYYTCTAVQRSPYYRSCSLAQLCSGRHCQFQALHTARSTISLHCNKIAEAEAAVSVSHKPAASADQDAYQQDGNTAGWLRLLSQRHLAVSTSRCRSTWVHLQDDDLTVSSSGTCKETLLIYNNFGITPSIDAASRAASVQLCWPLAPHNTQ
jgi:hypothetical protein